MNTSSFKALFIKHLHAVPSDVSIFPLYQCLQTIITCSIPALEDVWSSLIDYILLHVFMLVASCVFRVREKNRYLIFIMRHRFEIIYLRQRVRYRLFIVIFFYCIKLGFSKISCIISITSSGKVSSTRCCALLIVGYNMSPFSP